MKIPYNYHTHTYRCGHAIGKDEEYVKAAIKVGIKSFGFSDHVFLPGVHEEGIRADYEELDEYINSINALKEKYKDKIEIYVGFEAEHFPEFIDYYKDLLDSKKIDYLILGHHSYLVDNKVTDYFYKGCPKSNLYRYTEDIIEGMRSGLYKYVCHPDLFMDYYPEFDEDMRVCSIKIIEEAERLNLPLEVNLGGIGEPFWDMEHNYSCRGFFELTKNYNVKIILGLDSHNPKEINEANIEKAMNFIMTLSLNFDPNYHI